MIAELFLIMDLLGDTVDTPISPSAKPQAVRQTKGSTANLAAGLFRVGPITEIKQSFELPTMTPKEASDAYLDAIEGIEITSLPFLGKR
tara:strand:- start:399 stop:665 length:267 start_codon:yes stop_codon:yes gene_type:complete